MALPTISRTWQFINNVSLPMQGSAYATHRRLFWEFKNILTTFPTNPWVCVASSSAAACVRLGVDALGPPGPAYDLWGATYDSSKIHWRANDTWGTYDGTLKHSWIVLRNTALDTTYDLCIDLWPSTTDHTTYNIKYFKMYVCRSYDLTGSGSVTARPTPTAGYAELDLRNGNLDSYGGWGSNPSWDVPFRIHGQMSTDGLGTRIILCSAHVVVGFYAFDRIEGCTSSYINNPVWACGRGDYTLWWSNTYGWLHDNAIQQYDASVVGAPGAALRYYLGCQGMGGSAVPEAWAVNEVSTKWPMCPVDVIQDYATLRGRMGYIKDLWWGPALSRPMTTIPNDGTRTMAHMGHLIFPWDGGNLYTHTL